MILHEFDENKEAIVNPGFAYEKIENFPKIAISCFSRRTFNRILEKQPHREIGIIDSANIVIPIYEIEYEGLKNCTFQFLCWCIRLCCIFRRTGLFWNEKINFIW